MSQINLRKNLPFVSIEYIGGLGNQLFGLFTAANIAINHKIPLYIIDSESSPSITPRKTYWHETKLFQENWLIEKGILVKELPDNNLETEIIAEPENHIPFDLDTAVRNNVIIDNKNIILRGYWQSPRYFSENLNKIIEFLGINLSEIDTNIDSDKTSTPIKVAIHIRHGDYIRFGHIFHILNNEYYQKTVAHIARRITQTMRRPFKIEFEIYTDYFTMSKNSRLPDDEFIRFTRSFFDRIDKAYMGLYFGGFTAKIISNPDMNEIDEFIRMISCDHHIIANSTFSWWAAYLSNVVKYKSVEKHESHYVYSVAKWFRDGHN